MSDTEKLIALAEEILSSELSQDQQVSLIQAYAEAFDSWFASRKDGNDKSLIQSERDRVEKLHELHSSVIEKALAFQAQTSDTLRKLRKRGKGILAYAGSAPKRSSTAPRKKW